MPHNLTEADAFTAPIAVPDGTDSRNNASAVVSAIAQALANRTKHLNDHVAKKDVANTFTALQTFGSGIVIPNVQGSVTLVGALDVAGDLYAGDDVIAEDEFQYASPVPTRTKSINVLEGMGSGTLVNVGEYISVAVGGFWMLPVRAPHGAVLTTVRVKMFLPSGFAATADVHLYKRSAPNFGTDSNPAYALVASAGATTLTANQNTNFSVSFGSLTVSKDETYSIAIRNDSGSANPFYVSAAEFTFADPGPRNH